MGQAGREPQVGLVTFMERLNDSPAMNEERLVEWLNASAKVAEARGE